MSLSLLRTCCLVPPQGVDHAYARIKVLRHAFAVVVRVAEVVLRAGMTLLSGLARPLHRFSISLCGTLCPALAQRRCLLPCDGGLRAAQEEFLDLAGCRLRQGIDEAHPLRRFEMREIVAHMLFELGFAGLRTLT
jgi:hypothetical protein